MLFAVLLLLLALLCSIFLFYFGGKYFVFKNNVNVENVKKDDEMPDETEETCEKEEISAEFAENEEKEDEQVSRRSSTSESLMVMLEGSPKSTSSCISSEIPLESLPSTYSEAPTFDFSREMPEFVPRMMTEEFESLDRRIEKRKLDIRDLLRRIQSTKRQHRRFSEHLQRVQHDNEY